jgi:hypothetical protein
MLFGKVMSEIREEFEPRKAEIGRTDRPLNGFSAHFEALQRLFNNLEFYDATDQTT